MKKLCGILILLTLPVIAIGATKTAIFAGGCFWCMEADFDKVPGVTSTTSGYIGGTKPNPTYKSVSAGNDGYYEAIEISYDTDKVSYQSLLDVFWRNVDPEDAFGQFCDKGPSYLSAIFYLNTQQEKLALASKQLLVDSGALSQVATQIKPATTFYPAENYHQDYYTKNPIRYKYYRYRCGRDKRLEQLWGNQENI